MIPAEARTDSRTFWRFWTKVNVGDGCWIWKGSLDTHGYGSFRFDARTVTAYKFAYEWMSGDVPQGLELDHLCRNPVCVRPDHMEPVTHQVNVQRGMAGAHQLAKTQCPQGHPYDGVYHGTWRRCSVCAREAGRRYDAKRRTHA